MSDDEKVSSVMTALRVSPVILSEADEIIARMERAGLGESWTRSGVLRLALREGLEALARRLEQIEGVTL